MRLLVASILVGCAGASSSPSSSSSSSSAISVCISDAERGEIEITGTPDERFEAAMSLIDVPARPDERTAWEVESDGMHAVVLFDSVERDADPPRARVAAMLAIDVLEHLGTARAACGDEACARLPAVLSRHCRDELPPDDLTAVCPTLRLYGSRCGGGT